MERFGDKVICNPKVKLNKDNTYPLIDINKINPQFRYVSNQEEVTYTGQSCSKFDDHDVLFARITPCLENGKTAIANTNGKSGLGSTELFVFRGIEGISNTDYIYYLLSMPYMRKLAANSMTGASGRQRADLKFIKRIPWTYPNLEVQEKIADILSKYDELIEVNNQRIKKLEQAAEELYKEWFVRFRFPNHQNTEFENGIPKGWKVNKTKAVVKRLPFGELYKAEDTEKEGNVIVIDQSQDEYVGFHNNKPSHIATKDKPIIIFGDHSCKNQLMITPFSLSENVVPFVSNDTAPTCYLFYAMHNLIETTEYKRHWSELMSKKILLPTEELTISFANIIKPLLGLIEQIKTQNRNLINQRDLLLPRLMSGKLEV